MFFLILKQTVTLAFRKGGGALGTVAFYVIAVTLFTFALGPTVMARYAGAAMAVAMLFASLVALPLIYERDYEDGTLEQLLLSPALLEVIALAKICGQWLAIALPILIASPLVAVLCNLPWHDLQRAWWLLVLASPSMVAISSIGAAITIGTKRGGLLQALIVLPLYIPLLIFAASGGQGAAFILGAILCASVPVSCYVTAALLRLSLD
jgi:heme exporter protein B